MARIIFLFLQMGQSIELFPDINLTAMKAGLKIRAPIPTIRNNFGTRT